MEKLTFFFTYGAVTLSWIKRTDASIRLFYCKVLNHQFLFDFIIS